LFILSEQYSKALVLTSVIFKYLDWIDKFF